MVRTSTKLIKDWDKYNPIGNVVANTRLFAFKAPLRFELVRRYARKDRFTVQDLHRTLLFKNMPLGLVINATNTERYYNSREISDAGIEYRKLPSSGRNFVESENVVKAFIKIVDEFLERNSDNDLLIGVHCTDGVRRTGYLICRYMVEKMGVSINDALNAFETARGYNIERGDLVQALYRADRSHKMKINRTRESEEEEEELPERERRKRKRRQKDVIDDSFDAHTMQEIQSLVKTIKQMQSEPQPQPSYDSSNFTQMQMNSITVGNATATSIAFQQFHQNQSTPQQNISETSSPYIDQDFEDEDDDEEDNTPFDMSRLGRIDQLTDAQKRRNRRKNLKKQFNAMKHGRIWELKDLRGK